MSAVQHDSSPDIMSAADLADVLDLGVLRVDPSLVVVAWNHWMEVATGRPASEAVGQPIDRLFPELDPRTREAFATAVRGSTVVMSHRFHRWLLPLPPSSGFEMFEHMQQSARLVPSHDAQGTVTGVLVLITDVTDRVAREAELAVAAEAAEAASKAKSDFLTAMSHELRTPIGAIWSYADLLAQNIFGDIAEAQRDPLLRIKAVSEHLLGIVEEILTFARVEAGRETLRSEPVDLVRVAADAVTAVESIAIRKGLEVSSELPASPLVTTTDAVKLRQILINLLGNAIKFTDAGTVGIRLSTGSAGWASYFVHDSGRGIAEKDQAQIFEPFTQVVTSHARLHPGTGLGLTVSLRLARLLGGDILVTSAEGKGSTFEVRIPVVESTA